MPPPRTAVIAGASGLVGGFCLRQLLEEKAFDRVISLVRKPLAVTHPKLTQMECDFSQMGGVGPLKGAAVFCALGTTIKKAGSQDAFRMVDYEYPLRLAEFAHRDGATSFAVVSSIGADHRSGNFYLRVKGELEEALRRRGFRCLHIFQPSFLMGERKENRPAERAGIAVARVVQYAMAGPLGIYRPIEASDVGRAMVRAVLRESQGERVYRWREIRSLAA